VPVSPVAGLGRRAGLDAELCALGDPELVPARVLAAHRGRWLVASPGDGLPRLVPARDNLRDREGGPPVTGDWVALDAGGAVARVLERRGAVVRRAPGTPTSAQVLAANVELALVVEPFPDPNPRRLERLVALAVAGGVPAALVLTKADLCREDEETGAVAARLARSLGVADGVAVSAVDGAGLPVLRGMLDPEGTAVVLGPSGAGKSTLVNALLGVERQATGPVREADSRGRHTTVVRELLQLPGGALLIDTPGIREAGLWDGMGDVYEDVEELAAMCRFSNCTHGDEPGCAVRDAVDPARLAAWQKLVREQAWIEDRRAAARERAARGKSIARAQRAALRHAPRIHDR
jgi:ribosome biogenesis GTPase